MMMDALAHVAFAAVIIGSLFGLATLDILLDDRKAKKRS